MARRLRIAHLGKYYAPARGGIESHVRDLARAQASLGVEVEVICLGHDSRRTRVEQDGDVRVTRVGRWAHAAKLDLCPELPSVLRRVDADILHLQVPNPTMILGLLRARPSGALVVGYQSDHVNQGLTAKLFRPLEHALYRDVARILTSSPRYADASDLLGKYRDRVGTFPPGIDLAGHEATPEILAEASRIRARYGSPLWFFCGRLVPYKGVIHAVRAMPSTPGTLLVAGVGPERPALEREAARLGVSERVRFLGGVPDVKPYYRAADAFWLPSVNRSEAFGVVQLEAMAAGCPVLNTQIQGSGVAWVSQHDVSGLTVAPGDPQALARAAARLAESPELRARLSAGSLRRAKEFELFGTAQRSLRIYEDVLGRPQVAAPLEAPGAG